MMGFRRWGERPHPLEAIDRPAADLRRSPKKRWHEDEPAPPPPAPCLSTLPGYPEYRPSEGESLSMLG